MLKSVDPYDLANGGSVKIHVKKGRDRILDATIVVRWSICLFMLTWWIIIL